MDVAIDQVWSLKEEQPCRGNNWRNEEVIDLLNAIKTNNLMKGGPSGNQLGHLVEPLMGFKRSAFQITGKLKNLRKSYLRCERRGRTPTALRDCPYYDILTEIYGSEEEIQDSDAANGDVVQDIKVCSERGIEMMFEVIRELNLASSLTLESFSGKAVRLISKMLIARGICASVDQVKSTLIGLRKTYIEIRHGKHTKQTSLHYRYYEYLHTLWGAMPLPNLLVNGKLTKPKIELSSGNRERGDYWSEEETVVLLTSIKALKITREAKKNSDKAAKKLHDALRDSGYARSSSQIQRRLDNLRNNYRHAKRAKSSEDATRRFPFYHLYDSIFGARSIAEVRSCEPTPSKKLVPESSGRATRADGNDDNDNNDDDDDDDAEEPVVFVEKAKHSRSRAWSDDETVLMLSLLEELNLVHHIAHRLSFEVAGEVVEPLREHGYARSAMQIQIKLRNLRKSYYRCIRAGSTEVAIADCPFYYKLDSIFKKPDDGRKLRTTRKYEPVDANYVNVMESYNDHSYFNAVSKQQGPRKEPKFERVSEEDYENSEVWLPVETICDEDSAVVDEQAEDAASGFGDENTSSFEEVEETGMYANNEEANAPNDLEDPLEESTASVNDDTGQCSRKIDSPVKDASCHETEKPGPSRESSVQNDSSTLEPITRKSRRNLANPYSLRTKKDSPTLRSMKIVMAEVLRHEKLLQRQHHVWMERQFEMQRKHDRDQRELLIKELREFRKSITSTVSKPQIANNQRLN